MMPPLNLLMQREEDDSKFGKAGGKASTAPFLEILVSTEGGEVGRERGAGIACRCFEEGPSREEVNSAEEEVDVVVGRW